MTNQSHFDDFLDCKCEQIYTVEPHGDGFVLYYGRCNHRHGYNLVYLKEPAINFDPEHIQKLLQLGHKQYTKGTNQ